MIATVLMVLDVIVCIALIASVLMQSGKGSGLSDAFGGGGGGAFFGKGNDVDTLMAKVRLVWVLLLVSSRLLWQNQRLIG